MNSTMHRVDMPYTRPAVEALFGYAHAHDVEHGGRYDPGSTAVTIWSHHGQYPTTREESKTVATFYFRWAPTSMLWQIETDEGLTLEDLSQEIGRLQHGGLPPGGCTPWPSTA